MYHPWSHRNIAPPGRNGSIPWTLLLLALLLLVPVSPVEAQRRKSKGKPKPAAWRKPVEVPRTRGIICKKCNGKGWLWCTKHKKSFIALEAGVPYSSSGAGCKGCDGMLRIDCTACRNPAAETWLKQYHAKRRKWIASKRIYDKKVKHQLLHLASPHFVMIFDIPKLKVGRRLLKRHELAHLYLDRLEALYERFKKVMVCYDSDFKPPFHICIWNNPFDQAIVGPMFTGISSRGGHGSKLMGARCALTTARGRGTSKDPDLHRCVVHNTTHLLLSNIEPHQWIGKRKAGWLDAGVAHYFEFLLDGLCKNFCFTEQNTHLDFKGGKWRAWIRRQIAMGGKSLPKYLTYYTKLIDELTPLEHALSFSVVEFLITKHGGKKLKQLVQGIMRKRPQREVFKEVYGFSIMGLEDKWRAHVLATYPTRE